MMKKIIKLCIIFCTLSSYNILTQWVSINSPTIDNILTIQAVHQDLIYIGTHLGYIFKTTNRGLNWSQLTRPDSGLISDINFLNESTGFITFTFNPCGAFKTTNGGINWVKLEVSPSNSLFFPTANLGYILKYDFPISINKTTNGGINFTTTLINEYGNYFGIDLEPVNAVSMYLLAFNSNQPDTSMILKTINGGGNWGLSSKIPGKDFYNLSFFNSNTGVVCGFNGALARTTNQGVNWILLSSGINSNFHSVKNNGTSNGYLIGESGKILKSTNTGLNWFEQNSGVNTDLNDMVIFPGDTGYIVGKLGKILKTVNGGVTTVTQLSTQIPGDYSLKQNYPNPFNPSTNIRFSISNSGFVKLIIYDALGRSVAVLVNEKFTAGEYETTFDASHLPSGVYLYRIETPFFTETKKMILVK